MAGRKSHSFQRLKANFPWVVMVSIFLLHLTGGFSSIGERISRANSGSTTKPDEIDEMQASGSGATEAYAGKRRARVKAILLSSQCSGSSWVGDVLNKQPQVDFALETLIEYSRIHEKLWNSTEWSTFEHDLDRALAGANHVTGFKLMYDQIPPHLYHDFLGYLASNSIHVIHLRRKTAILQLACGYQRRSRMRENGIAHYKSAEVLPSTPDPKMPLTPDVLSRITLIEERQKVFSSYLSVAASFPYYEVWYEDLDGAFGERFFAAMFSFIGVDGSDALNRSTYFKGGQKLCESRVEGLHAPDYLELNGTYSREACAQLHSAENNHPAYGSIFELQKFYPSYERRRYLTPGA